MNYKNFVFCGITFLASHAMLQAQTPRYSVIDLGTIRGNSSVGYGINNLGQVVGVDNTYTAFIYSNGSMSAVGNLLNVVSRAYAINDAGSITGWYRSTNQSDHAFVYSGGILSDLGGVNTTGFGINNSGEVAGNGDSTGGNTTPFLYSGGHLNNLGAQGGIYSRGYGINNSGQIAGDVYVTTGNPHAFLYSSGRTQDLGTLGGTQSWARGINDSGWVTGTSYQANSSIAHAFIYSNGSMTDIGNGSAWGVTNGYGINNSGQVVGMGNKIGNEKHVFLYTGGAMYDMNDLLPANSSITGILISDNGEPINDWGQITGSGRVNNQTHAILLNPLTPLESTIGQSHNAKIVSSINFNQTHAQTGTGGFSTTVSLLDGIATANRDVTTVIDNSFHLRLASDVVELTGTGNDTFVFQLSYNEASAISLFGNEANARLMWLDPADSQWKNAVAGNTGLSTSFFAGDGSYDALTDFHLGTYGVDTANNTVWAVINHNSSFGVTTAVPEPGTYVFLAAGFLFGWVAWRGKSQIGKL